MEGTRTALTAMTLCELVGRVSELGLCGAVSSRGAVSVLVHVMLLLLLLLLLLVMVAREAGRWSALPLPVPLPLAALRVPIQVLMKAIKGYRCPLK